MTNALRDQTFDSHLVQTKNINANIENNFADNSCSIKININIIQLKGKKFKMSTENFVDPNNSSINTDRDEKFMQMLSHIEESIESVVKNSLHLVQIEHDNSKKSDIIESKRKNNKNESNVNRTTKYENNVSSKKRGRKKHLDQVMNNNFQSNSAINDKSANQRKKDIFTGPYLFVEKKKNQISYSVINSIPKADDKEFKQKPSYNSHNNVKRLNSIIQKENDHSWICVFCKRPPHYKQLGDLFGPYYLNNIEKSSNQDLDNGNDKMTLSNFAINDNANIKKIEIWFHEDCVVWSNGIYLAGTIIRNMDEVIKECSDIVCCECKLKGANIGCVNKGCNMTFHYICAKEKDCDFNEENFSIICYNHKKK